MPDQLKETLEIQEAPGTLEAGQSQGVASAPSPPQGFYTAFEMDLARRVTELEKDKVQIVAAQEKFATKYELNSTMSQILVKLAGIDGKMEALEGKFQGLEGKFQGLEGKFDGLNKRLSLHSALLVVILGAILAGVVSWVIKMF
jgi:hypothetical protein